MPSPTSTPCGAKTSNSTRSKTSSISNYMTRITGCTSHGSTSLTNKSVWRGRVLFLSCLAGCAAVLTYFAHTILTESEHQLADTMFDSIADRALQTAHKMTLTKALGSKTLATVFSRRFPYAAQWPNVALDGFEDISTHIIDTARGRGMGFCPIVRAPEELQDFENFAYDYFNTTFGPNNTVGLSSFGRGVFRRDPKLNTTDKRIKETHGILAPMIQFYSGPADHLMYNMRADPKRTNLIDDMIECYAQQEDQDSALSHDSRWQWQCGMISNFQNVVSPVDKARGVKFQPGAYILAPIRPAKGAHTGKLPGFIMSSMQWKQVLHEVFSDEVSGIDCVVAKTATDQDNEEAYTFTVKHGIADLKTTTEGDCHDPKYDKFKHTIVLTEGIFDNQASTTYTLSLYPNEQFFQVYSTMNPKVAAIGVVGIIFLTSLMFFVYDCLVHRNLREKQSLLEAKKKFVRYVSHEVRTPLNSVVMGLKLLQEEISALFPSSTGSGNKTKSTPPPTPNSSCSLKTTQQSSPHAAFMSLSNDILASSNVAVHVLNEFLSYDKISTNSLNLDLTILSIWKLLEDTVREFKLFSDSKHINVGLDLSALLSLDDDNDDPGGKDEEMGVRKIDQVSELPLNVQELRVVGDPSRLAQVVRNLLSNALKFTPGHGKITVSASVLPLEGNHLHFSRIKKRAGTITLNDGQEFSFLPTSQIQVCVKDTGAGLTPEQVQGLFSAGVQFNVNELQAGHGSGLGLYIAKGITELHGGDLTAESEGIGKGASFILRVPLYHIPDENLPPSLEKRLQIRPVPTPKLEEGVLLVKEDSQTSTESRQRILVVDDAVMNRKLLKRLLEKRGHVCDEAKDGAECLDKFLQAKNDCVYYDTILLDYEMPVLNGPDALLKLRECGCDSFVVGITGNVLPEDMAYFKSCGAASVLPKPVNLDELETVWMEYGVTTSRNVNSYHSHAGINSAANRNRIDQNETRKSSLPPSA